mmetsp:Transcript_6036/g.15564  ORF Transcript_6036/g.15564 Transcript_6036/m.15564 type:complete len:299 (+) Transcript_6036:890-1786(+)
MLMTGGAAGSSSARSMPCQLSAIMGGSGVSSASAFSAVVCASLSCAIASVSASASFLLGPASASSRRRRRTMRLIMSLELVPGGGSPSPKGSRTFQLTRGVITSLMRSSRSSSARSLYFSTSSVSSAILFSAVIKVVAGTSLAFCASTSCTRASASATCRFMCCMRSRSAFSWSSASSRADVLSASSRLWSSRSRSRSLRARFSSSLAPVDSICMSRSLSCRASTSARSVALASSDSATFSCSMARCPSTFTIALWCSMSAAVKRSRSASSCFFSASRRSATTNHGIWSNARLPPSEL